VLIIDVIHSYPQARQIRSEATEELDALGWRLVVVIAGDLFDALEQVLARVQAALIERGATGIRRHFKTEWLRYFTPS
jgi:hypothetical protein